MHVNGIEFFLEQKLLILKIKSAADLYATILELKEKNNIALINKIYLKNSRLLSTRIMNEIMKN